MKTYKFKFTPEQRSEVKKAIGDSVLSEISNSVFSKLYYDFGCDYLVDEGDVSLQDEKKFKQAWNDVFKKYRGEFVVSNSLVQRLEEDIIDTIVEVVDHEEFINMFDHCDRVVKKMNKEVLALPEVKQLMKEAKQRADMLLEQKLKEQLEKLGYEVTMSKKGKTKR